MAQYRLSGDKNLINMNTDFALDPLRSDPRFAELVRKMGVVVAAVAVCQIAQSLANSACDPVRVA
jgi:hypothetical protein